MHVPQPLQFILAMELNLHKYKQWLIDKQCDSIHVITVNEYINIV